jgi:hypothetical protein
MSRLDWIDSVVHRAGRQAVQQRRIYSLALRAGILNLIFS